MARRPAMPMEIEASEFTELLFSVLRSQDSVTCGGLSLVSSLWDFADYSWKSKKPGIDKHIGPLIIPCKLALKQGFALEARLLKGGYFLAG